MDRRAGVGTWQPASYLYAKYKELTGVELATYPFLERLDRLDEAGLIYWTDKPGALPRYKQFLDGASGLPLPDVWSDIDAINSQADERLGYPTQKPEALLERKVEASSDIGDTVLDPFCGCGTTIAVAQRLNRNWIGIDITHLAIGLIRHRLQDSHGESIKSTYQVIGEPTSVPDAETLAATDPFQFQAWALGLVGARHAGSVKKGADKGIDGRIYFHEGDTGKTKQIILLREGGQLHGSTSATCAACWSVKRRRWPRYSALRNQRNPCGLRLRRLVFTNRRGGSIQAADRDCRRTTGRQAAGCAGQSGRRARRSSGHRRRRRSRRRTANLICSQTILTSRSERGAASEN